MMIRAILVLLAVIVSSPVDAADADRIYLEETVISGNQELPKVLYIVPWREQVGQAVAPVRPGLRLREVMTPVYPHEYRRELEYRHLVKIMQLPEPIE